MLGDFLLGLAWLFFAGALGLFLAGRLKQTLLELLARAFGARFSPALYAMLTLPGFFLHEAAHALAALLLRVPIRSVTFIPRRSVDDLAVGSSVQVARRDPLRMALIALAPLLVGTLVLGLLTGLLGSNSTSPHPWTRLPEWAASLNYGSVDFWLAAYLIWALGGTLAPSRADMEHVRRGALGLLLLLAATGGILYLVGEQAIAWLGTLLGRLGDGLAAAAVLNGIVLLPLAVLQMALSRRY